MRSAISFVFMIFAMLAELPAQSNPPTASFPISSITVDGNRILGSSGIATASGLKTGETGGTPAFDAARDRLLATGYFETVAYRFKAAEKGSGYDIAFEVQEMQPLYTLHVEALQVIEPDLIAWLRSKDPLFTGKLPGTEQVLARTSREIEEYLASKGHPANVAGKIVLIASQHYEARFTPDTGLPNVALVSFEGNKVIRNVELQNAIAAVAFGQPYTEELFRLLLDSQLKPLYEKSGYMRVKFGKLTASPSSLVKGLDVQVQIDEGQQYKLGTITVRGGALGNGEDQTKHILRVAKVPKMPVVDFDQLRAAAVRVKDDLRHEGYLDAEVSVDRDINDETKTVDVFFVPQPGVQYTFGKLDVKGLGLDGVAAVNKAWVVKTGEPFPAEYPDYFLKRVKEEGWFDNLGETRAEPEINADTHSVNVMLNFRYEPVQKKKIPVPGQPPDHP